MATTYTPLLELPKHDPTGPFDITKINEGFDLIDAGMAKAYRGKAANSILDNGDFLPGYVVNQREQTTYTGDWVYSIDRWMINAANGEISLLDNGIAISVNEGQNVRLVQRIPFKIVNPAKAYTIAYKRDDGTICCGSGLVNNCTFSDGGIRFAQFTTGIDQEFYYLIIDCYGGTVIEWVALYEGAYTADTLPEYQHKGYAVELAECQRYHIAPGRQPVQGWCYDWGRLEVHIPLPITMRLSSPTITIGAGASGFWVGGTAYSWEYQGCATVPNGIVLYFTHSAGVSGQAIIPELSVSINCDL